MRYRTTLVWLGGALGLGGAACGSVDDNVPSQTTANLPCEVGAGFQQSALPGGSLDPTSVPKYESPLVIPPAMPRTAKLRVKGVKQTDADERTDYNDHSKYGKHTGGKDSKHRTIIDYYEIAVREFSQEILPSSMNLSTRVWSYGRASDPTPGAGVTDTSFNYPAFTIEAKWNVPVRVKWINELVRDPDDCFHKPKGAPQKPDSCHFLPHLLPVDQTLHWANPPGDCRMGSPRPDCAGVSDEPYAGPVPIVTHVHGAHTTEESDGYPEAWVLPAADDIPAYVQFTGGTFYEYFKAAFESRWGTGRRAAWTPGSSVFQYPNDMRAATLWYHDHTLGMTRNNVYAGPAGFYVLRGGPGDQVRSRTGTWATWARLPGPAPSVGDPPGVDYYEIPLAIQDRSFNDDGSLFYPANRDFFEGLPPGGLSELGVQFTPAGTPMSDVAPIWNPEFFGNTMVVNGKTWPHLDVEPRRYRFRLLNGSDSRFLILQLVRATDPNNPDTWTQVSGAMTQLGAEGGFLPAPKPLDELLMGPAERADVIVDFKKIELGPDEGLYLVNVGPDEPFGGGVPGQDFLKAHPGTTGQVMKFNLVPKKGFDWTTPPKRLVLPRRAPLPAPDAVRQLSLNELMSMNQTVCLDLEGNPVPIAARPCPDGVTSTVCTDGAGGFDVIAGAECLDPSYPTPVPVVEEVFGPVAALLGTLNADGTPRPLAWHEAITEDPPEGGTEIWELYNFTADAHPIHVHLVQFEVVDRQLLAVDETGMSVQPAVLCEAPSSDPSCADPTRGPLVRGPEPWETGLKDTVIAYPGQVTRIKAKFDIAGLFVWHCHILEHEDNEMMRPYCVTGEAGEIPASCATAGIEP